ncbi:MAG TPA: GNAT family N-acetyltransferase [Ktedonobacterales bacterium]|nr:GNAT family N-acetyltransferase [Ktedonobacterales bacterium]
MSDKQTYAVVGVRQLTAEQAEQARALRDLCNSADGLDLKLGISAGFATQSAEPYAFLCALDGVLVGFCTLSGDDDPELELCGMVHPAYRRRGIGRALLDAALASARRRLATLRVLVICEDASASGRAFVAAAGGRHSFSENRMETAATPPAHAPHVPTSPRELDVREAGQDEAYELARVIAASFGQSDDHMAEDIVRDMTVEGERYFLARLGDEPNEPVGAFKIFVDKPKAYIYAFGVLPEFRRRGYGRAILEDVLARLFAEGWTAVGLEVDADNTPAQALYRSVGFHDVTVYGYYVLDITTR